MNSVYMRVESQSENAACSACMGEGRCIDHSYRTGERYEHACLQCDGSGYSFTFTEKENRTVFFKVLTLFVDAIEKFYDKNYPYTQEDFDKLVKELVEFILPIPDVRILYDEKAAFSTIVIEDHGIVFREDRILAVF